MSAALTAIGIALGAGSAVCQTVSYVFSRLYVLRSRQAVVHLLILSHLFMGVVSAALLLGMQPRLPPFATYAAALAGTAGFYVVAQAALFGLMRITSPSKVAPLLGMKILVLAALSHAGLNAALTATQWQAVAMATLAVLLLNAWGGAIGWRGWLTLAVAVTGYSLSDLNIAALIRTVDTTGSPLRASLVAAGLAYAALGGVALGFAPILRRDHDRRTTLRFALPFAAAWFTGMLLLFGSIACIGVVYAILLQSTRAILSIVAGAWIAHLGYAHIEGRIPRALFWRRVAAAALMVGAIARYYGG